MTCAERKRLWQQRNEDWQASGVSCMAYCEQQSLTSCRFVYWRKKLTEPEKLVPEKPVSSPGGILITGLYAGNVELLGAVLRQL